MIHLITGGSGSGKSEYAERVIAKCQSECLSGPLLYVATMFPYGEETRSKIERHRVMRAGKGFVTIECYTGLKQTAMEIGEKYPDCSVLLECMSNLTANELYMEGGAGQEALTEIREGIEILAQNCRHLVIVTNEVNSDGMVISAEMEHYRKILGAINCRLAAMADRVTEIVYGIAVEVKK